MNKIGIIIFLQDSIRSHSAIQDVFNLELERISYISESSSKIDSQSSSIREESRDDSFFISTFKPQGSPAMAPLGYSTIFKRVASYFINIISRTGKGIGHMGKLDK